MIQIVTEPVIPEPSIMVWAHALYIQNITFWTIGFTIVGAWMLEVLYKKLIGIYHKHLAKKEIRCGEPELIYPEMEI